ncbi:MAG TPA: hypothetical protein VLC52_11095 [Anaerolineae bacterium]|nr:hypothetical protein [Anaerolineae bacterium]
MARKKKTKQAGYTRYPLKSLLAYNGLTVLHYLLGAAGLWLGYRSSWAGPALAAAYLAFAFGQMYLLLPRQVCRHCVYTRLQSGRCISGLNVLARKLGRPGDARLFATRARGPFSPNNVCLAARILPILGLVPALIVDLTLLLLGIALALVALLLLRVLVLFPRVACARCLARNACPNAAAMGLAGR